MTINDYHQVEILLVEDNPNDAELTMRGLKKANCKMLGKLERFETSSVFIAIIRFVGTIFGGLRSVFRFSIAWTGGSTG